MPTLRADTINNTAGTGAPDFPNGLTVGGNSLRYQHKQYADDTTEGAATLVTISGLTNGVNYKITIGAHDFTREAGPGNQDTSLKFYIDGVTQLVAGCPANGSANIDETDEVCGGTSSGIFTFSTGQVWQVDTNVSSANGRIKAPHVTVEELPLNGSTTAFLGV